MTGPYDVIIGPWDAWSKSVTAKSCTAGLDHFNLWDDLIGVFVVGVGFRASWLDTVHQSSLPPRLHLATLWHDMIRVFSTGSGPCQNGSIFVLAKPRVIGIFALALWRGSFR